MPNQRFIRLALEAVVSGRGHSCPRYPVVALVLKSRCLVLLKRIGFSNVAFCAERLQIFFNSLPTVGPSDYVINMQCRIWMLRRTVSTHLADA